MADDKDGKKDDKAKKKNPKSELSESQKNEIK